MSSPFPYIQSIKMLVFMILAASWLSYMIHPTKRHLFFVVWFKKYFLNHTRMSYNHVDCIYYWIYVKVFWWWLTLKFCKYIYCSIICIIIVIPFVNQNASSWIVGIGMIIDQYSMIYVTTLLLIDIVKIKLNWFVNSLAVCSMCRDIDVVFIMLHRDSAKQVVIHANKN